MKKKFQVFVSSTYTDMIEERQAAVQAILDAGHIPAGMELFKAGNESQLKTIYKWINDCDVYMLILGGRYGSIEPNTGKSYTHLEYEYAISKNIPVFSVVLNQKFLTEKISILGLDKVTEQQNPDKLKLFKEFVMSKIIREVEDCKDIKLSVHTTLNEFIYENKLVGWIKGDSVDNSINLTNENKELSKENLQLLKQVQKLTDQLNTQSKNSIGEYGLLDIVNIMKAKIFNVPPGLTEDKKPFEVNAYDLFKIYYDKFCTGISNTYNMSDESSFIFFDCCPFYMGFGLLEKVKLSGTTAQRIQISKLGQKFFALLQINGIDIVKKNSANI